MGQAAGGVPRPLQMTTGGPSQLLRQPATVVPSELVTVNRLTRGSCH
jgi:hypothetical protein